MGLIKAALGSVNQVVGDQFKEFITCPPVGNDVVIQRGVVNHGDANKTFTEGVISNGSGIAVPSGMAMMIVDNGKIVEFTSEEGTYTYDTSSEPSIFTGGLGAGLVESIKTIGSRITYGGQPARDQRVYYVNIKLIPGLTYGSQQPVMIKDPIYQSVRVTYNGMYAVKVIDPAILIANLVGANPKDTLTLNDIFTSEGNTSMLKQQFAQNVGQAISQLMTTKNVSFVEIQNYQSDITTLMNQLLDASWRANYGIAVGDVTININATEDSLKIMQEMDAEIAKAARLGQVYANNMAGTMAAATASAMNAAASNDNGAMMGFMGMGMAQAQGANVLNTAMGAQPQATPEAPVQPTPGQAFAGVVQPQEAPQTEEAPVEETPAE
jgi:membrane protease subunit (stomatin/prohibitin family)